MIRHPFEMYFIFLIYTLFCINYGASQIKVIREREAMYDISPEKEIQNMNCDCSAFKYLEGVTCRSIGRHKKEISELYFYDYKHIPAGMLTGCTIFELRLNDSDINVDENFLDGVLELTMLTVERSSIKVKYLFLCINVCINLSLYRVCQKKKGTRINCLSVKEKWVL